MEHAPGRSMYTSDIKLMGALRIKLSVRRVFRSENIMSQNLLSFGNIVIDTRACMMGKCKTCKTRQSEMANTSPRHMPVLGNVHPIKI